MPKASKPSPPGGASIPPGGAEPNIEPSNHSLKQFDPLSFAEQSLLEAAKRGTVAHLGDSPPTTKSPENALRASFLKFLVLGIDPSFSIHSRGVQAVGAYIDEQLDLNGCTSAVSLRLESCFFSHSPDLGDALMKEVRLSRSLFPGLAADGVTLRGSLVLQKVVSTQSISLTGATIGRHLECTGASLRGSGEEALRFDQARISGSVFLDTGFRAEGEVRLLSCEVAGTFQCAGGKFENPGADALSMDGAKIGSNVFLGEGFSSQGDVRLHGMVLQGSLFCSGGSFTHKGASALGVSRAQIDGEVQLKENFSAVGEVSFASTRIGRDLVIENSSFANEDGFALLLDGIQVDGSIVLREFVECSGKLSLVGARSTGLADDVSLLDAALILDGFCYDRIHDGPVAADKRIRWLKTQIPEKYDAVFWPQPWEHLIRVLRDMGHVEDARLIAIEKQRELRRLRVIGDRKAKPRKTRFTTRIEQRRIRLTNGFIRALHWLYGALAGYGYRPMRTVGWMALIWAVLAGVNALAYHQGLFVPKAVSAQPAEADSAPFKRTSFSPAIFTLDTMLPFVDLKQENDWTPAVERRDGTTNWFGWGVRALMWFEILFGWLASLLLVSAVGRLVQKD